MKFKQILILSGVVFLSGCVTTITTTTPNGDVTVAKYKKGAYRAKVQAETLRAITDKVNANKLAVASAEKDKVRCAAPNMAGAAETAQIILALAYDRCTGAPDSDSIAMIVSAATGNPLDPDAQAYVSYNRTESNIYAQDQATKRAWITGGLSIIPSALYVYRDIALANNQGPAGQSISFRDGGTLSITGSNSGAQDGIGGAGGGEGAGGDGMAEQQRQLAISVFGDSGNGYLYGQDNARLGLGVQRSQPLINDVSGTMSGLNGDVDQREVVVTDEAPNSPNRRNK